MKTLIIAEKNSVAKKLTAALCKNPKYEKGFVEDANFIITHCVGHLLQYIKPSEIDEKYKKWNIANLPFAFEEIPMGISESVKDQFKVVKTCLKRQDIGEIINACDPDREGERIFRSIYDYVNPKCQKMTRMWIETVSSNEALREAYEKRKDGHLYEPLYMAAKARAEADYHIGLNGTQAVSVLFGNGNLLPIGRVQTPTLAIIVDLERQIQNFVSKPFWKIVAHTKEDIDGLYYDPTLTDNRFDVKTDCQAVIDKTGLGPATVTDVLVSTRQDEPRKLYNLSDLQIEMNKRYKYSAQEVLDICQSLYEKHGLTTYPRTNENQISPEMASKSMMIVKGLPSLFDRQKSDVVGNNYCLNHRVIAKKDKIGAHEALTPVPEAHISDSKIQELTVAELNVYKAIVERFLAAFYPNAIFEKQEITFERNSSIFKNKIENLIVPGHYQAYEAFKGKNNIEFIKLKQGDKINISELEMVEGATQPPSRLTEGTLLKVMINPTKYVSDKNEKKILESTEGLGTEATRASIIENLKKQGCIEFKRDKIYPTEKGMKLIDLLPECDVKRVSLTAYFEKQLSLIAEGKYSRESFMKEIFKADEDLINILKETKPITTFENNSDNKSNGKAKSLCSCPQCKSNILEGKYGWYCSNKECKVNLFYTAAKNFGLAKITATMAKELLGKNAKTKKKCNLYSEKKQKEYQAYLTYRFDAGAQYPNSIGISFDENKN